MIFLGRIRRKYAVHWLGVRRSIVGDYEMDGVDGVDWVDRIVYSRS